MRTIPALLFTLTASALLGAEPHVPPVGPEVEKITVISGDVGLLLRRGTQWTPGRLDYLGKPMTTERSAYGTVFKFPGVGFIGTGHFENEPEDLQSVRFFVEDEEVVTPTETLAAKTFRFERDSIIRGISLQNTIELKDNRIYETATVSSTDEVPLDLVYHFMHAWVPEMTHFAAGQSGQSARDEGVFETTPETVGKFYVNAHVDWVAVFHAPSGRFAVSRLITSPEAAQETTQLWNRPPTYRKYYSRSFFNRSLPAGFRGTWKMVTGFGESPLDSWQAATERLASELETDPAKTED